MKTYYECMPCFANQALRASKDLEEETREKIMREVFAEMSVIDFSDCPPQIARKVFDIIEKHTSKKDTYREIKEKSNNYILNLEGELREIISQANDSFEAGLRLAIAGNIIDFGANHKFSNESIHQEIKQALKFKISSAVITDFKKAICNADKILYLGDNAGEIVFDKLFIEQLPTNKVTFAVRGIHVINDVLLEDAEKVGITSLVPVISNGAGYPGTVLEKCSKEFQKVFEESDIVISKGQGNYETLNSCPKHIFFLLKVKCEVIAKNINRKVGEFIIKESTKGSLS